MSPTSLLDLPDKLLLPIGTWEPFRHPFLYPSAWRRPTPNIRAESKLRRSVRISLSQTSSRLRRIFFPLAWEHMEISLSRIPGFAKRILPEMRAAGVFPHVQSVTISAPWGSTEPCNSGVQSDTEYLIDILDISEICLHFLQTDLPNLALLRLHMAARPLYCFAQSLTRHTLPQVEALAGLGWGDPRLRAFPNLTMLACPVAHWAPLSDDMSEFLPQGIAALSGVPSSPSALRDLLEYYPNIKALNMTLDCSDSAPHHIVFYQLSGLWNLSYLSLVVDAGDRPEIHRAIQGGRRALRSSLSASRKLLEVWATGHLEGLDGTPFFAEVVV
ncbi:hypothetical protein C8F01DRAFT_1129699 [Mycena amicta]|nr:hypothetical protein C8F01DRAFT_1129699 [Mycena amicta]